MAAERRAVVAAARRLDELGLNYGRTGNVGLRAPGGLLVTPQLYAACGLPFIALAPAAIALTMLW